GYPVISQVQKAKHLASIGCLVSDGHRIYALTNRHVAGRTGEKLYTTLHGKEIEIGQSSDKQIGRLPFEELYQTWPGKSISVNMDVVLIRVINWRPGHNPEPGQRFPGRGYRRNIEVLPTISYGGPLCYCRSPCLSPWSSWWTVSPCLPRPRGDGGVPQCIPI